MSRSLVAAVTAIGADVIAEVAPDFGTPGDATALAGAVIAGRLERVLAAAGLKLREAP